ncbi:MAG: hypothetical protein FD180_1256 [Planctomycetota bacterium]|nr:MAG: hypothetical protein FD180_1256 [Planctomycetota bacterium]
MRDFRLAVSAALLIVLASWVRAGDEEKEKEEEHKPPHGGVLLEVGEEVAHLELVRDEKEGKLTIYVLDAKAEKAVTIKDVPKINLTTKDGAKQVVTEAFEPDKEGLASQFEATNDELKAHVLEGRIAVTIGGKKYNIDLPKDKHDHDHDDQDHDHK